MPYPSLKTCSLLTFVPTACIFLFHTWLLVCGLGKRVSLFLWFPQVSTRDFCRGRVEGGEGPTLPPERPVCPTPEGGETDFDGCAGSYRKFDIRRQEREKVQGIERERRAFSLKRHLLLVRSTTSITFEDKKKKKQRASNVWNKAKFAKSYKNCRWCFGRKKISFS